MGTQLTHPPHASFYEYLYVNFEKKHFNGPLPYSTTVCTLLPVAMICMYEEVRRKEVRRKEREFFDRDKITVLVLQHVCVVDGTSTINNTECCL